MSQESDWQSDSASAGLMAHSAVAIRSFLTVLRKFFKLDQMMRRRRDSRLLVLSRRETHSAEAGLLCRAPELEG